MTPRELADHAHDIASQGLMVFPCRLNKVPATKHGFLDATSDPTEAWGLFMNCEGAALISIATGSRTGIIAIDIDPQGMRWFQTHITKFPETRIDETPRKGFHLLYRSTDTRIRNSCGKIAKGIDVRGEDGSCIIAPGPGYTTIHDVELAPLPEWIVRKLTKKPKAEKIDEGAGSGNVGALERFVSASPVGERNNRLYWAANKLREAVAAGNASASDQRVLLSAAVQAGLSRPEASATIRSGMVARAR
jgi:hypothetical protein